MVAVLHDQNAESVDGDGMPIILLGMKYGSHDVGDAIWHRK
jgi:hypothetical protein